MQTVEAESESRITGRYNPNAQQSFTGSVVDGVARELHSRLAARFPAILPAVAEVSPYTLDFSQHKSIPEYGVDTYSRTEGSQWFKSVTPDATGHGYMEYNFWLWTPGQYFDAQSSWTVSVDASAVLETVGNFVVDKVAVTTGFVNFRALARCLVKQASKTFTTRVGMYCMADGSVGGAFYGYLRCGVIVSQATLSIEKLSHLALCDSVSSEDTEGSDFENLD